jgi:hypothetical protein
METKSVTKIAVVAHDAGAANHIFSWLQSGLIDIDKVQFCVDGPAAVICNRLFPDFINYKLKMVLNTTTLLVSGTGWASTLEHDARCIAKKRNIHVVAVLDHWSNFRERFIWSGCEQLPDEVWVVDEYAYDIAKKKLPNVYAVLQRNDFIESQLQEIKKNDHKNEQGNRILFVMEPIRKTWGVEGKQGEIQALDYLIENIELLHLKGLVEIIIKPHPSDQKGKYDALLSEYENLKLSIDENSTLASLIAWSEIVAGCQTYAMVVAIAAGKTVVSTLPPVSPPCLLPQKEIIHMSELVLTNEVL